MDNYAYQPDENSKPFAITRYPSVKRPPNDYLVEVNSRSKLFKGTKFYKIFTAALLVLIFILVIGLLIILLMYYKNNNDNEICTTEECLRSAANLRLSIDPNTNPCEDFYKYTCGRWSKEHPNHGWFPSFSAFSTISERILIATEEFLLSEENDSEPLPVRQTRYFYQSCMDEDSRDELGFSVLFKYLREVELPLVPSLFTKTNQEIADFKFDWLKSEAVIKKMLAMDVLIGFTVDANIYNRSENVMYIGVPGQACPLPSPFKKNKDKAEESHFDELRRETNFKIVKFILSTIILNVTAKEADENILQQATEVLLNITSYIDEIVANYTVYNETPESFSVHEFQKKTNDYLTSTINKDVPDIYQRYVNYLFEGTNVTANFDKDLFYMGPSDLEYLPRMLRYVLTTSDIYLELYMWWVTVFAMIINTTSEVAEFIFKQTAPFYVGNPVIRPRSLDCSSLVNSFMGMAVSYGLADRTFTNRTKPKIEQMLYDIKNAFVDHVTSITWMDKDTKQATLEKSKEMISFIGYPDWLLDKGALETYYKGLGMRNDSYLENMMSFVRNYFPGKFEHLRKINERNWSTDPITVNAFNSFSDNAINVPMGIISFPVYNLGLEVLNYGAIGSVLGHELTHGFDNSGRKHDKFGNLKQWWTNETVNTFEDKIQCFIKQYDNFSFEGVDKHVQGEKTLGENLADNGGLSHAFRAYQQFIKRNGPEAKLPGFENFTSNQLFFIAFGSIWCESLTLDDLETQIEYDEHSPNSVRVLGTLQNSPEFSKEFNCPLGSKMNPNRNRCKVW